MRQRSTNFDLLVAEDAQDGGANSNGRYNGGAFFARPAAATAAAFEDMVRRCNVPI